MRKQRKKHSFISIFFIIVLIIIICISIKMMLSILEEQNVKIENITSNTNDYEVSSKTKNNEISILPEESVKIESPKKRESRAIKLAKGEKSNNSLPVLMYHFFYDDSEDPVAPDSNYMPISSFEKQLEYLSENDYYYPTWDEVADFVDGKIDLPDKSVVLTMDDGDDSVFIYALPLLEKYNVPATAFVITSEFDENEIKKYKDSILDLESHTDNMHRGGGTVGHNGIFPSLSLEEGTADLKTSIKKLGGNSGALAYPFGDFTDRTKEATKNAGFKVAFTTVNDKVKPGMDKYELPRLRMFSDIKLPGFKYYVQ